MGPKPYYKDKKKSMSKLFALANAVLILDTTMLTSNPTFLLMLSDFALIFYILCYYNG